jgi:altronate hydrolase
MPSPTRWLRLHPEDNVVVIVSDEGATAGTTLDIPGHPVTVAQATPKGHKVAISRLEAGAAVIKLGGAIGVATRAIDVGEHVHVHNVALPPASLFTQEKRLPSARYSALLPTHFDGYRRANGRAGTRNMIVVAASVNCSATVVKAICQHFRGADLAARGIDGVVPLTHAQGCAQAIGGAGHSTLNRTLAGSIFHPNVVGAVIVGLGCEGTTASTILAARPNGATDIPIETFGIQDTGGTAAAIRAGIAAVERVFAQLLPFAREAVPISEITLALNCGGSDAFSAITANPALGVASDLLVERGATVALAEIPECHGAEGLLFARCRTDRERARLRELFAWWHDHANKHGVELNENLAPGNISGGITTIIEKSLGALAKAGSSELAMVVGYAEPIAERGFVLMNTPGFDPVSVTGLVAGGSNIVAFTTGRGSVYGCAIAPTVKIATTSSLFARMRDDMDFDAGRALADGVEIVGIELFRSLIDVASGRTTRSEEAGLGWEEFAPWPVGETL